MFRRKETLCRKKIHELELSKSKIEHRKTIICGFFVLHKLNYLCWNAGFLFLPICQFFFDLTNSKNWKWIRTLFLAVAHGNLHNCIRPARKEEREDLREKDCKDSFRADASQNFFPTTCFSKLKKHDK